MGAGQAQLLSQAKESLNSDPQRTKDLAKFALDKYGEPGSAWLLYGMAACKQKNKHEAYNAYKHLDVSKRQNLLDSCAASEFPLL